MQLLMEAYRGAKAANQIQNERLRNKYETITRNC